MRCRGSMRGLRFQIHSLKHPNQLSYFIVCARRQFPSSLPAPSGPHTAPLRPRKARRRCPPAAIGANWCRQPKTRSMRRLGRHRAPPPETSAAAATRPSTPRTRPFDAPSTKRGARSLDVPLTPSPRRHTRASCLAKEKAAAARARASPGDSTSSASKARPPVLSNESRLNRTSARASTPRPCVGVGAGVYMGAVLKRRPCAEILELASSPARDNKKTRIVPRRIQLAVCNDEERRRRPRLGRRRRRRRAPEHPRDAAPQEGAPDAPLGGGRGAFSVSDFGIWGLRVRVPSELDVVVTRKPPRSRAPAGAATASRVSLLHRLVGPPPALTPRVARHHPPTAPASARRPPRAAAAAPERTPGDREPADRPGSPPAAAVLLDRSPWRHLRLPRVFWTLFSAAV